MKRKFADLKVGMSVLDMHDSNDIQAYIEEPTYGSTWQNGNVPGMGKMIQMLVRANNPRLSGYTYTNKMLVVVSINPDGSVTLAYSYDDHRGGFCTIEQRK